MTQGHVRGPDRPARTQQGGSLSAAPELLTWLIDRRAEMVGTLAELVGLETPSDDGALLHRCAALLERRFGELGDDLRRHRAGVGEVLRLGIDAGPGDNRAPVVVVGHYDTVWPAGTLASRPFEAEAEVARGPGSYDAKGGIVALEFALRGLAALGLRPARPVVALLTPDEELGSPRSRALIAAETRGAAAALILEPALPGGALKTSRKGILRFRIEAMGRAAHAGLDPERGASAIRELAAQVLHVYELADLAAGTTVNVGTITGGTRLNVVAERAIAEIDVRVSTTAEADQLEAALRAFTPDLAGTQLRIERLGGRPPMGRANGTARLFAHARALVAAVGLELTEGAAGGASDGNLTAALGVPTLDGLGPDGDGAHAVDECVRPASLPERAALLALLLAQPLPEA